MYNFNMKIGIWLFIILALLFLLGKTNNTKSEFSQVDACLDKGYCWDMIRNRCEKYNQGFCINSKKDCLLRNGKWQENEQFCNFKN